MSVALVGSPGAWAAASVVMVTLLWICLPSGAWVPGTLEPRMYRPIRRAVAGLSLLMLAVSFWGASQGARAAVLAGAFWATLIAALIASNFPSKAARRRWCALPVFNRVVSVFLLLASVLAASLLWVAGAS